MEIITDHPIVSGNKVISKGASMDNIDISGLDREFNAFNGAGAFASPAVKSAATATKAAEAAKMQKIKGDKKAKLQANLGKAKNLAQDTGIIDYGKSKLQELFGGAAPASSNPEPLQKDEKKDNTGKIIGFAIGGVALIALIYFATKSSSKK